MRVMPILAIGLAAVAGPAFAQDGNSPADRRDIAAVVEAFRSGVIAKDKAALDKLVVSPDISFMSGADADTLAWVRTRRPDAKRLIPGSYPAFVQEITSSTDRLEETVSDLVIHGNGTIATVYFSYRFKENDIVANWGDESWGLIATDDGWKISSIIWSMTVAKPKQP